MKKAQLDAVISMKDFSLGEEENFGLTEKILWIKEIIDEVESEIDPDLKEEGHALSNVELSLEITRQDNDDELEDHLVIRGHLKAQIDSHCIRCLKVVKQNLETHFSYCFLSARKEQEEFFKEAIEVFCEGEEMELHFYEKNGKIDLKEIVYEQIQISLEPLPLHSEDCKGLCQICGTDLNKETCKHQ